MECTGCSGKATESVPPAAMSKTATELVMHHHSRAGTTTMACGWQELGRADQAPPLPLVCVFSASAEVVLVVVADPRGDCSWDLGSTVPASSLSKPCSAAFLNACVVGTLDFVVGSVRDLRPRVHVAFGGRRDLERAN